MLGFGYHGNMDCWLCTIIQGFTYVIPDDLKKKGLGMLFTYFYVSL